MAIALSRMLRTSSSINQLRNKRTILIKLTRIEQEIADRCKSKEINKI